MALVQAVSNANRRSVEMKRCEVVRVDSPAFLINSRQNACRYETAAGKPLVRGYYLVLWPAKASPAVYGRELRYLGPFPTRAAACLLQTSALGLGIVESGKDSCPAASSAGSRWL